MTNLADMGRLQVERQRQLAYVDTCVGDVVKARRTLDRALDELATAQAALDEREEQLRAMLAEARKGA